MEAAAEETAMTDANVDNSPLLMLLLLAVVAVVSLNDVGLLSLLFLSGRLRVELMTLEAADDGLCATEDEERVKAGFLSPTEDRLSESNTARVGDLRCVDGRGRGGGGAGRARGTRGLLFMAL